MKRVVALFGFAVLITTGCGGGSSKSGPTATVTGKVTLAGGKALSGGRINFLLAGDGSKGAVADIKADGSYEAKDVPQGECTVTVTNIHLKPAANPTSADAPVDPSLKYIPIADKYGIATTSGLTTNVSGPTHTYNPELK